jgi:hypothetical protein
VHIRITLQDINTVKAIDRMSQLPPGLSDEEFEIFTALQMRWARILDDELRKAVGGVVALCAEPPPIDAMKEMTGDQQIALLRRRTDQISSAFGDANGLLGELLRKELDRRSLAATLATGTGTDRLTTGGRLAR